jgi:hypothetical protein
LNATVGDNKLNFGKLAVKSGFTVAITLGLPSPSRAGHRFSYCDTYEVFFASSINLIADTQFTEVT